MYGSNLGEAMNNSKAYDTIAAISILFEIQKEDNPAMEPITEGELIKGQFKYTFRTSSSLARGGAMGHLHPTSLDS